MLRSIQLYNTFDNTAYMTVKFLVCHTSLSYKCIYVINLVYLNKNNLMAQRLKSPQKLN